MIGLSGRTNISSGDYLGFFFSLYGLPVIIVGIVVLILILGLDINTFIILSALVEEQKLDLKLKDVLLAAIRSIKNFFSPLGIGLVIYVAIVLPIIDFGIKLGPLENFKIPNFITSVIFDSPFYSTIYTAAVIILFIISLFYVFSIHFMLIGDQDAPTAFRSSRRLMTKYWLRFIVDYVIKSIKLFGLILMSGALAFGAILLISIGLGLFYGEENVLAIAVILSVFELIGAATFLAIPIAIGFVTQLYYKYNKLESKPPKIGLVAQAKKLDKNRLYQKIRVKTKVEVAAFVILATMLNFGAAIVAEDSFSEIFKTKVNIEIIAHRGGGDLEAENTVASNKLPRCKQRGIFSRIIIHQC